MQASTGMPPGPSAHSAYTPPALRLPHPRSGVVYDPVERVVLCEKLLMIVPLRAPGEPKGHSTIAPGQSRRNTAVAQCLSAQASSQFVERLVAGITVEYLYS
jgi:hypothetical protein